MPLSKYYGGAGESVMSKMQSEYGREKGERVFYATMNKMKQNRSVMGRKVIHNSPDKHPEQGDAMNDQFNEMMKGFDQGRQSPTYGGSRKDLKPLQKPSPEPAKKLEGGLEYMRKLGGSK